VHDMIIGVHQEIVIRLRTLVLHLVYIYFIAHREALVAKDTNDSFSELAFIDRTANKVYEWLGSSMIHRAIMEKLLLVFCEEIRVVLQIHNYVRWPSCRLVMERLIFCMLAILEAWEVDVRCSAIESILHRYHSCGPMLMIGGSSSRLAFRIFGCPRAFRCHKIFRCHRAT
jgi:hypothetical protein